MYEAKEATRITQNAPNIADIRLPTLKEKFILNDRLANSERNTMVMALTAIIYEVAEYWKQETPHITFVVEHPLWQPVIELLRTKISGNVIFDLMDNHRGFDQISSSATKMELKLLKMADTTIVSSSYLKKYALMHTKQVAIVRNATDFLHFSNYLPNGELEPLKSKPIIGYFGALNEWFDMELVAKVAQANPQWNFVLIGSVSSCNFAPVEHAHNVFFLGEKPYATLPGYMSYFDVCMIPFKLNPLTMATNPVKFYEYLSMGKQIVSTPLPELFPYRQNCQLADSAIDFAKAIQRALQINRGRTARTSSARQQKLARHNTWEKRWLKFKKLL
jgi:glycosyltransferase involved in cell wall biosynthesis